VPRHRLLAGILVAAVAALGACGSSDAIGDAGDDASMDAGSLDGSSDSGSDAFGGDAPSSTDGPIDADAGNCGLRSGQRGLTTRSVMVGGTKRTYLVYLPPTFDPRTPAPFVYVFHGYSMSGQQMHDITQYTALADTEGIALAFPDGLGGPDAFASPWNVESPGQTLCGGGQGVTTASDDFGFMDAMKADVASDQCVDAAHVFSSGFSMGGYFSHHVACYKSDIRAVAPHSGGMLASLAACTTGHVPIIIFHGTSDGTIVPGCDDPNSPAQAGFPASATLWAAKNGCQSTYTTVTTNGTSGAGQCYVYDGCPPGGQVELCTFTGMGHCWAGGSTAGQGALFGCPTYADATALEWAFFKKYAW
jgi:polyhydroxybutyrate depolymerase